MPRYRHALPQLHGQPVLTDGGLETSLLFHHGVELPEFCSFPALEHEAGRAAVEAYFDPFVEVARRHDVAFELSSTTWRANPDWVERLTGSRDATAAINARAIDFLCAYRDRIDGDQVVTIAGAVGPRGDGYIADRAMTAEGAADYHRPQIEAFARTDADLACAFTLNYVEEAIGVALAARGAGIPAAISFTVETDGRLPTGQPLGEAIQQTDEATGSAPAYYMINCAHPTHFDAILDGSTPWAARLQGLRANASTLSHAELEAMTELDEGDPEDLGRRVGSLRERLPHLSVLGGCCGTDHRHIAAIAAACFG